MKHKKLLLLTTLIVLNLSLSAQDKKFYIFLAFGQSNMQGEAKIQAQDTVNVNPRFKVLEALNCPELNREKGIWYTAVPPLCRCNTGLTPVDYFGRYLLEKLPKDITVGVINVAVGGCKIELFDKDRYHSYIVTAPDWMTSIIAKYNGDPYGRLVELGKIAQKDGVIKGILLHQGEANMGDATWPQQVKVVYNNLLKDLNLSADKVPLLAGEVVNEDQNGRRANMNSIIATLPKVIPTAHIISSKGCTAGPDHLHFDAAGYRELGRRYAEQMLALISINSY